MDIKTVPQPPYSPDLASCDFCLFPKLRSCRFETIKEMKEVVTKFIDTLTEEDFHEALQKILEWYNKCIAAGGDYFEAPILKMSGNLFNDPRTCRNQSKQKLTLLFLFYSVLLTQSYGDIFALLHRSSYYIFYAERAHACLSRITA